MNSTPFDNARQNSAENSPLGRDVAYPSTYTPSLLHSIARAQAREPLGIREPLPFVGEDLWHAYELSWLNNRGKPEVAHLRVQIPCSSACIVESKSLKLYLNSFCQTPFRSRADVQNTIASDLSVGFRAPVLVTLLSVDQLPQTPGFPGVCLDELDIDCEVYDVEPELLSCEDSEVQVNETLYSHLFRSLCPVTGQPDWAGIMVQYRGVPIERASLLRYLVSYRQHAAFHETTVEQIFADLVHRCGPEELTVYARFLRRGGLDINPLRSTRLDAAPNVADPRQ